MNSPRLRTGIQILVVAVGILLPYLARIPGILTRGPAWFTSFLDGGIGAAVFFGAFNAVLWASVLLAVRSYRHARSAWFPVIIGFALPALAYATIDLAASSTAALGLVFIPLEAVPLVAVGWLVGRYFDRRSPPTAPTLSPS